ncbi:hypothetical protein K227x_64110 [Rubripirellula lacrimiformis]|uniref:Lipocalin-like domain-containing protein n=1 Tax=Rubripirellula lacrimiformis TaxID=1930273 RepID=A0A517NLH1_9BACT|nr:hypothetical protein [Rubripirellula lacrimiformis]QDT07981.1 hypothetical protein K227x_64110 [Rubripirellula lacrimiformis]
MDEGPSIVSYVMGAAFCALLIYWQVIRGKAKKATANREPRAITLADLHGKWRVVSFGQNGGKAPFFIARRMKARLVVEGDRFTKFMGDRPFAAGRLVISTDGNHSTFDEYVDTADASDSVSLGIIRWVGDKIEHLQGKAGEDRPTRFPYSSDSKCGYALMKRE